MIISNESFTKRKRENFYSYPHCLFLETILLDENCRRILDSFFKNPLSLKRNTFSLKIWRMHKTWKILVTNVSSINSPRSFASFSRRLGAAHYAKDAGKSRRCDQSIAIFHRESDWTRAGLISDNVSFAEAKERRIRPVLRSGRRSPADVRSSIRTNASRFLPCLCACHAWSMTRSMREISDRSRMLSSFFFLPLPPLTFRLIVAVGIIGRVVSFRWR